MLALPALLVLLLAPSPIQDPAPNPIDVTIWPEGDGKSPPEGSRTLRPPIVPTKWRVRRGDAETARRVLAEELLAPLDPWGRRKGKPRDDSEWLDLEPGAELPPDAVAVRTTLLCDGDQVRMARLSGAGVLVVNGDCLVGDAEERGYEGVPVALGGRNDILVTDLRGPFQLTLLDPPSTARIEGGDVEWPTLYEWISAELRFPVFNASDEVQHLRVHYGHAVMDPGEPSIEEWQSPWLLQPLSMKRTSTYFWDQEEGVEVPSAGTATVPICVYTHGDVDTDRRLFSGPITRDRPDFDSRRRPRAESLLARVPLPGADESIALVVGTVGTDDEDARLLARARYDQQVVWYEAGVIPELVLDSRPEDWVARYRTTGWVEAGSNGIRPRLLLVLYGNRDTVHGFEEALAGVPLEVENGRVRIGEVEHRGDDLCGWAVARQPDGTEVVALFDTGEKGARAGYLMRALVEPRPEADFELFEAGEDGLRRIAGGKWE